MIYPNGDERIGEKTIGITFDNRRNDSYNCHRSIFIPCFHNYMIKLFPPTSYMKSMIGFNSQNEVISPFKALGRKWMSCKVDTWKSRI